ncbi:hypothetical protein vseg_020976 [Gypsophila vaccaria]
MAAPPNVELEAAKFLHKLIQDSTDEPARLATKLFVILQHMKGSGKENSMPYQVISRAMETVVNQHGLDIEALTASRLPSSSGAQGESATTHATGSSQTLPVTDSKLVMPGNDSTRTDGVGSYRPSAAPNSLGHDLFQGPVSQRSGRSFDHESPSSIDTKSTNSQDRRETANREQQSAQKNLNRPGVKRKKSDPSAIEPPVDSIQQSDSYNTVPDMKKERLTSKVEMPEKNPGVSESWNQGFKSTPYFPETSVPGLLPSSSHANVSTANFNSSSCSGASGMQLGTDRFLQAANPSTVSEVGALRSPANRDTGRPPSITNMPFKEHHLKQLRAQCLVFLAFRNGLAPKRLHLEIALGNILVQEGASGSVDGSQNELMLDKGKRPSTLESSCTAEASLLLVNPSLVKNERPVTGTVATESVPELDAILNETKNVKPAGAEMGVSNEPSHIDAENHVPAVHSHDGSLQPGGTNQGDYGLGTNKPLKSEMTRWTGVVQNDYSRSALAACIPHDLGTRKDGSSNVSQHEGDILNLPRGVSHLSTSWKAIQGDNGAVDKTLSVMDGSKIVPGFDSGYIQRSPSPLGSEPEEEDKSVSAGLPPSSKQTLSEKWIMAHQKRKVVNEQKWVCKLQKADQRIECRFNELKETVTSAEDISAKTKSVIELKKLQLLDLQRRLRRNIINDFFKPVQSEMDQLKSIKKHRIGRRMKHVEKYEQKMKEERQKRIRERQKEFFSEIEVHKERLEDVFKFKRERCKGFVRHVKEFHKRKERIHREKIDRIQREKINLLKINDVEGYLRMVQDAKSDRVKQLLKETEKYLQKLGSKLQEAKTSAREVDIDENRIAILDESTENAAETEDQIDQAKHYKESNEKYYLIAHSIKENITEQPAGIQGGKLREYQMNGLRWLVSLYNNHLNGILADEMGLGKTVQVISLLCYLMEAKNDRGPFLVVVPSSVLPGWEREMSFWAPGINKIVYTGPPEERRRLFKDCIVHQKFNVLLTTYEYLMNKHDRPKLSKIPWHYVIIDEGHRIKNASCKLNADLKHYQSSHRLLLTGTPLQNSLEELWALLNFLLPNIFNSSEDFSQWFNKPFEGNGDSSPDEALLSEEENLLIINRLHQVLRPFVLRRLKHKVENELPEKIERLVRCEASAYQKLLMMRVEENLGSLGMTKGRAIHNTVMELRNICNHPYLSQLHVEEVDSLIPKHYLPPIIRLCGKLEMLDRLLPKLKETNHRVLFFSTMTRLLDIMEDYLVWKQYRYLRLDGHTSGQDRGALIEKFNQPESPFFIFLLSIRAGGVGVNLQAADTVIIFDTDWNPQVDLQAQARAHRIGQKKDVLVLRLETVKSVEEQVRAAAEHKLGVANQSITAGFFDNNTSAEDRREYLESLLRESKKEEAATVLDDDSLNDILARSEPEIAVFEEIDKKRREEEMAIWKMLVQERGGDVAEALPPLPSRLVTEDDLNAFYEAMKKNETARDGATSSSGIKRKGGYVGGFDNQQYGRGKRAREVRSYEEQWSEEEFEKMCQSEYPGSIMLKDEKVNVPQSSESVQIAAKVEIPLQSLQPLPTSLESSLLVKKVTPPVKRGRGRPRRTPTDASQLQKAIVSTVTDQIGVDSVGDSATTKDASGGSHGTDATSLTSEATQPLPGAQSAQGSATVATQPKRQGRKGQTSQNNLPGESGTETIRRRGRKPSCALPSAASRVQDLVPGEKLKHPSSATSVSVNVIPKVTSDNSSADGPCGALPKCAEGSDISTLKDGNGVELAAKSNSSDVSLKATSSPTHEKGEKSGALSQSQAQKHMAILSGVAVENSKQPVSDSSAVNSSPREPKDVSKAEPIRRRGRKRGLSASADSISPASQDKKSQEPLNIAGSAVATSASGSMSHGRMGLAPSDPSSLRPSPILSGVGSIPSDTRKTPDGCQNLGQTQIDVCAETTPRRRGRKSSVSPASDRDSVGQYSTARQIDRKDGDIAEGKIITTRSRQVNNIEQSLSVKADGIGNPLETRHTSTVEDIKADFPPISSKGKTNVIVLALDAPSRDIDPIGMGDKNMQEKKTFSKLQVESSLSASALKPERPRLGFTQATDIEVAKLDEELSAPPGFETSRQCLFDAAVTKSGKQNDTGISSSPNAKMGSVVLALKSASQTSVPTIGCQSISEKYENMFVPPGFYIPQKRLSESVAATTIACDDGQTSDKLAESAIYVRVEEDCQGSVSGDNGHDTNEKKGLSVLDSGTAAVVIGEDPHDISGPSNTEQHLVDASAMSIISPCNAAATTSELNDKASHETNSGNIGHDTNDDSLAVCVVESNTTAKNTLENELAITKQILVVSVTASVTAPRNASFPESKEQQESHDRDSADIGHDNSDALLVVAMVDSGTYNEATSVLESKEHEDPHCTALDNSEHGTIDAPLADCTTDSSTTAALTLEVKENDQLGHGNTKDNVIDASSTSLTSIHNAATAATVSEVPGESHGPDSGHIVHDTIDGSQGVCVDSGYATTSELKEDGYSLGPVNPGQNVLGSSIASVSELELKVKEDLLGPGNCDSGHESSDAPIATGVLDSDTAVALTLELKEKGVVNNEQNMLEASTASVPCPYSHSTATSDLDLKEQEESHGPDRADIRHDASDAPVTTCVGDSDTTVAQTLELKQKRDDHAADSGDIGHDTIDAPEAVCVKDSETTAALTLELEGKTDSHALADTELIAGAPTAPVASCSSVTASALELKEQELSCGIESGDIGHGTIDIPLAVSVVDSATAATLTLDLNEKGDHPWPDNSNQNVVDASTTSVTGRYSAAASALESNERASIHGPACGNFGHNRSEDPHSDTSAALTLELKEGEHLRPGYTEQNVVDTSSVPVDGTCNATPSPLKPKEQEESAGLERVHLGPGYTEQNVVHSSSGTVDVSMVSADDPCGAAPSSLKSKEQEESPGPSYTEQNVVDTSSAPVCVSTAYVDDPCSATPGSLQSKNQQVTPGPSYTEQNVLDTSTAPVDVSAASIDDPSNATPASLQTKEQDETPGPNNIEHDGVDASTAPVGVSAASVNDPCSACPSPLISKEQEDSPGAGYTEQNVADTSTVPVDVSTAFVDDPDNIITSSSKLEKSPGLGYTEENVADTSTAAVDVSTASIDDLSNVIPSSFKSEEHEPEQSPGLSAGPVDTEQNVVDTSTTPVDFSILSADDSFCATPSSLKSKEQEESSGPANILADGVNASPVSDVSPCNAAASVLEMKEQEESYGPANAEYNLIDATSASVAVPCTAAASALESKEQDESHGPKDCDADVSASDLATTSMDINSDSATVSASALKVEEGAPGLDDRIDRRDAAGSPSQVMAAIDTSSALNPESQIGETVHGPNDCKTQNEVGDNHTTSHVVESDNVVETTSESKAKTEDIVDVDHTTSHVDLDAKTEDRIGDDNTSVVDSDIVVETTSMSKVKTTEDEVDDNHTIPHVDSDGKTEDPMGDNNTSHVIDSDTVVETTSKSKPNAEDEVDHNNTSSHVDSDGTTKDPAGDNNTSHVDFVTEVETITQSKTKTEDNPSISHVDTDGNRLL